MDGTLLSRDLQVARWSPGRRMLRGPKPGDPWTVLIFAEEYRSISREQIERDD